MASSPTKRAKTEDEDIRVTVDLPHGRNYPVVITNRGTECVPEMIERYVANVSAKKCVVVSNSVVGKLPLRETLLKALAGAKWSASYLEIPDGEENKTPETYMRLVNDLLAQKVDRKTLVIGLGGGVTTDIVGFAAATVLRGLRFVNVPTTLLAMVDASVGGKTGVNTTHGKNLLGAFWQPELVIAPISVLSTLSDFEYRCGLGEVVKHAVLEKDDGEFFRYLYRALLNLGHTVGHAIENVLGYGAIPHGVAVAIGTVAEAKYGEMRGDAKPGIAKEIATLLRDVGLPWSLVEEDFISGGSQKKCTPDALLDAVFMDKKRDGSHITITVPFAVGDVRLVKIKPEELKTILSGLVELKALL